jgi:hypothetical protein
MKIPWFMSVAKYDGGNFGCEVKQVDFGDDGGVVRCWSSVS